jgi:cation transport ATPase
VGISGTDVAKEAADMVLGDDNFATIVRALERGRWIYYNIKKYLTYLLRANIMEVTVGGAGDRDLSGPAREDPTSNRPDPMAADGDMRRR